MENAVTPVQPSGSKSRGTVRLLKIVGVVFLSIALFLATLWTSAALFFDLPIAWLRSPLAIFYLVIMIAIWWLMKRRLAALFCISGFVLVLLWWLFIPPSNNGNWQPDVAILPYSTMTGKQVTVHNIRDCNYRTETDYDVHHYDKVFDLDRLRSVDFYLVTWGSPIIAHTMVSFGFDTGDFLCFSIETRKEKGESYSAIKGFFRQYELTYVIADERDLVRLRTNYRQGEEVFLYRLAASPSRARALLLSYLNRANQLREHAEWYNALTSNCTTNVRVQADEARGGRSPWDWRILLNGYSDELLYERGRIFTNVPFAELKHRCHINDRARLVGADPKFSVLIRTNLPGFVNNAIAQPSPTL